MAQACNNAVIVLILCFFTLSCATTTEQGAVGVSRKQFLLIPSNEVNQMANSEYDKLKKDASAKGILDTNRPQAQKVAVIAQKLIPHTAIFRKDAPGWAWETHVIASPTLNAFCMPGGKIAFYSGIIDKLQLTDGEIAAIMGHEIAHALREHGRERISQALVEQYGVEILLATGQVNRQYAGLISTGANLLLNLPFSRKQESEADQMGLEMMARAGYNPREAVTLWQKMGQQGGSKPPEILSTHPSDQTRIRQIEALLPKVMPIYEQARSEH